MCTVNDCGLPRRAETLASQPCWNGRLWAPKASAQDDAHVLARRRGGRGGPRAQARKTREKIGEPLPLDEDVLAQRLGGGVRIASEQCLDDLGVLVERRRHPVSDPKLEASIGPQPTLQCHRLLGEEATLRRAVDGVMKLLVCPEKLFRQVPFEELWPEEEKVS